MQNKNRTKRNTGFTLVEMLIVVAIIAILVAVSIPLVSSSLENARDKTDLANERAAKAEAAMVYLGAAEIEGFEEYKAGDTGTFFYDAESGKLTASNDIAPYGQCSTTHSDNIFAGDTDTTSATGPHTGRFAIIRVDIGANGLVTLSWSVDANSSVSGQVDPSQKEDLPSEVSQAFDAMIESLADNYPGQEDAIINALKNEVDKEKYAKIANLAYTAWTEYSKEKNEDILKYYTIEIAKEYGFGTNENDAQTKFWLQMVWDLISYGKVNHPDSFLGSSYTPPENP